MLPLKYFQCWSEWRWPFLVLSRKIIDRFIFLRLSPPGDRWCGVLGFVPAGNVSSSSTLQIFRDATRLSWLLFPPVYRSALSLPSGQYTHRIFRRWMSNVDTCQSGLPIPLFTFCSRLIESVRMMAWLCGLTVTSRGNSAESMCDCFSTVQLHCPHARGKIVRQQ